MVFNEPIAAYPCALQDWVSGRLKAYTADVQALFRPNL